VGRGDGALEEGLHIHGGGGDAGSLGIAFVLNRSSSPEARQSGPISRGGRRPNRPAGEGDPISMRGAPYKKKKKKKKGVIYRSAKLEKARHSRLNVCPEKRAREMRVVSLRPRRKEATAWSCWAFLV